MSGSGVLLLAHGPTSGQAYVVAAGTVPVFPAVISVTSFNPSPTPWLWGIGLLTMTLIIGWIFFLFFLCPGCSASRNCIRRAEFTFAMAFLKSLEVNQAWACSSGDFCSSHGKPCTHRHTYLALMSPVIGFCPVSHKGYHSLLALLPGFNKLFSYATSSAQALDGITASFPSKR